MKQFHKILFLASVAFLAGNAISCTSNFDDINTNTTKLDALDKSSMANAFAAAQYYSVAAGWQIYQSLFADLQGQYFANVAQNFPSDRNVMVGNWLNLAWNGFYGTAIPPLLVTLENSKPGAPNENAAIYAVASIWKVYMYLPRTDYWGPMPYSQVGNGKNSVEYDSQEFIYKDFLKTLASSVAALGAFRTTKVFGNHDQIYAGDAEKWIRFGNTLRLRIAMRISKAEPALAKTEAEAAVAGGVLSTHADDAFLKVTASSFNPMNQTTGWNEFRMSAAMESLLKGYDDPRMSKYFAPVLGTTNTFKGLRNGYSQTQVTLDENLPKANSNVADQFLPASQATNPFAIMYASEAYFLKAEGALNGWNMGGTAKDLYEMGIATSLKQWGIADAAIAAYVNGTTAPIALKDMVNTPPLTNVPVKFSSVPAEQREQIITQKWLANFPNGHEAWAEYRRTGYPKLYPRINSDNADSPKDAAVRRTPFVIGEYRANASAVQAAIDKLGGEDKSSTRLWWDKP